MTEGFLRGTGTLFGTYSVGFIGEQMFERFGFLLGSHLDSWIGGRIGLMAYDVVNRVHYLLPASQLVESKIIDHPTDEVYWSAAFSSSEAPEDSFVSETPTRESSQSSSEAPEESLISETPTYMSCEDSKEGNGYEAFDCVNSKLHEEF